MTSGEVGSQPHAVTGYVETAEVAWRFGRSRVPVVTALSLDLFLVLREGDALYRGSVDSLEPILLVAPVGEYSAHESRPMAGMTLGSRIPQCVGPNFARLSQGHGHALRRGESWPTWMWAPEAAPGMVPHEALNRMPADRR
jgi:hypothetical protein